ncbi:MAG: type IV pilus twitching motility protein PilT [Oscillospiraceae bacterium]|nr:type IV pilus twitching motility protein PilT [Oscillospiraceae bacterium]
MAEETNAKLNNILRRAIKSNASDVHITAGRGIAFRIDGALTPFDNHKMTPDEVRELVEPLYINNEMINRRMQENGEIDFAYSMTGESRFRVNVFHQRNSLACVMRLLPYDIPRPENLGIPQSVVELTKLKKGLVLVTGATGSGKSTTLASLIMTINRNYSDHIITLEDPIEYLHRHDLSIVNQRELGTDTKSFAAALRAALRQDPDVILVGEMRDLETISTAITAAETGHLVFSTLHTNDAASTIDRIIDVFPPHQQEQIRVQLANVLEAVISQQLLPDASGHGRVAAFEVLLANNAVRNLIRENKSFQIPSQIQINRRMGMQMMDDSLLDLYRDGKITKENAIRYAHDHGAMSKNLYY